MASRRDWLRMVSASLIASWLSSPRRLEALPAPRSRTDGPRYFLSIYLSGGIDAVASTDPKLREEVESWVDIPYPASSIVEAGALRLGPNLAPLAPFASRLTLVNGVGLHTANHQTGAEQFLRMRTGTRPQMPSLFELLGRGKDTQAIGCMDWLFGASQFGWLFGKASQGERGARRYPAAPSGGAPRCGPKRAGPGDCRPGG